MDENNEIPKELYISENCGLYIFEEDVIPHINYTMSISAQGKTVEIEIPGSVYRQLVDNFDHIERR